MLTEIQNQKLRDDINQNPALSGLPNNSDQAFFIKDFYNDQPPEPWFVWNTNVLAEDVMNNGFVWSTVDQLNAGKARIWEWLTRFGSFNPSKPNVRQGLADAFGANSPMASGIITHCKKESSLVQKLFSSGTGSNAVPATLDSNINQNFLLSYQEVITARNF